jgi:hypothetical protein
MAQSDEGTELLTESRLRGNLPPGFKTTLYDSDRLRQLENADLSTLNDVVDDYGSYELTEDDIIKAEIQRVLTAFQTPERTMEFPGTGMEVMNDHIRSFAARYKANQDTPSGTIKDARRANPDDIVFTFATPEVYDQISGSSQDNFDVTGQSVGTLELVDTDGLPDGGQSADTSLDLDDNEMLYYTGDFIDLSSGQSIFTAIQYVDIDGEDYGPDNGLFSTRLSGNHIFTGQGAWVKQTVDIDAKVIADGDAEIIPVAFYMGPGTNAPSLT